MKTLTWEEVEKQGWNNALRELVKIIHTSDMGGKDINRILDIIDKLKK